MNSIELVRVGLVLDIIGAILIATDLMNPIILEKFDSAAELIKEIDSSPHKSTNFLYNIIFRDVHLDEHNETKKLNSIIAIILLPLCIVLFLLLAFVFRLGIRQVQFPLAIVTKFKNIFGFRNLVPTLGIFLLITGFVFQFASTYK